MYTYVSMLRGINLVGRRMVKMPELRTLYEDLGFAAVRTYIQSGNVVFSSKRKDQASMGVAIEEAVRKSFGFPVTVIMRRPVEMGRIINACPFTGFKGIDEGKLHVTFLKARPNPALVSALESLAAKSTDGYRLGASEIYLHCPNGYGRTLLSNGFFEKHLKVAATTRNWRTVNALFDMSNTTPE